jgi:hypothetical protein
MAGRAIISGFLTAILASIPVSAAPSPKRNPYSFVLNNPFGDTIFGLGDSSYLANTKHPKADVAADYRVPGKSAAVPVTVIKTNVPSITKDTLEAILLSYADGDDVFNYDFLDGIYVWSSVKASFDTSALEYLASLNTSFVFVDKSVSGSGKLPTVSLKGTAELPAGPYLAAIGERTVSFATVYRLYEDTYRTFRFGTYDANDGEGNYVPLGVFLPKYYEAMIPYVKHPICKDLY